MTCHPKFVQDTFLGRLRSSMAFAFIAKKYIYMIILSQRDHFLRQPPHRPPTLDEWVKVG